MNPPAYKILELMKGFKSTSGYYDVFIPAINQLSKEDDFFSIQKSSFYID